MTQQTIFKCLLNWTEYNKYVTKGFSLMMVYKFSKITFLILGTTVIILKQIATPLEERKLTSRPLYEN